MSAVVKAVIDATCWPVTKNSLNLPVQFISSYLEHLLLIAEGALFLVLQLLECNPESVIIHELMVSLND